MVYIELLIALVLINGVLAMSELAVVSARRGRLKAMAEGGSRGATGALRLADDPGGLAHSSSRTGKTVGYAPSVVEVMYATLVSRQGIHA
ncbi:CNNM domain-containing protein [Reyranella sp.]|uniref:CNNM domain-containing protein n=1 Tax=Reyranella sp. TaxID=1929291 RepID=UPI003C7A316D